MNPFTDQSTRCGTVQGLRRDSSQTSLEDWNECLYTVFCIHRGCKHRFIRKPRFYVLFSFCLMVSVVCCWILGMPWMNTIYTDLNCIFDETIQELKNVKNTSTNTALKKDLSSLHDHRIYAIIDFSAYLALFVVALCSFVYGIYVIYFTKREAIEAIRAAEVDDSNRRAAETAVDPEPSPESNGLIAVNIESNQVPNSQERPISMNNIVFRRNHDNSKHRKCPYRVQIALLVAIIICMIVATIATVQISRLELSGTAKEHIIKAVRAVSTKSKTSLNKLQEDYKCCGFLRSDNKPSGEKYLSCSHIEEMRTCSEELADRLLGTGKSIVLIIAAVFLWVVFIIIVVMCYRDARRNQRKKAEKSAQRSVDLAAQACIPMQTYEMQTVIPTDNSPGST